MSVDGQEILALHELGYRFADSIEGLSCLQVQVLFEALRCRNERIRESLETQSESTREVRPLDELVHVLPHAAAESSPSKDESAAENVEKEVSKVKRCQDTA
jgi:hypothetical protein